MKRYFLFITIFFYHLAAIDYKVNDFKFFEHYSYNFDFSANQLKTKQNQPTSGPDNDILFHFDNEKLFQGESIVPVFSKNGYYNKCILFINSDNIIEYTSLDSQFLNENVDIGDFTIEFYFQSSKNRNDQILVQKYGSVLNTRDDTVIPQGFMIYMKDSQICAKFENFFHFNDRIKSVSLEKSTYIKLDKWYYFALTYDAVSGRLTKYVDNKEVDFTYTTENFKKESTIYYPAFLKENEYGLIFGKNFSGKIDEFSISMGNYKTFSDKKLNTANSIYISKVFSPAFYSRINSININSKITPDSHMQCFIRKSFDFFLADNNNLSWLEIDLLKSDGSHNDIELFKSPYNYYQIKIVLKNAGQNQNVINNININYDIEEAPQAPLITSVTSKNGALTIEWAKNTEYDIAGYKVYLAKNKFTKSKPHKILSSEYNSYTIKNLENGEIYYIALTAFDNWNINHESGMSEIINAVPSQFSQ